eukprot:5355107-Prymnesium_polylepis.2
MNSDLSKGPTTGATKRKSGANQSAPPLEPSAVPASWAAVNAFASIISSSGGIGNVLFAMRPSTSAIPAVGSLPSSAARSGRSVAEGEATDMSGGALRFGPAPPIV